MLFNSTLNTMQLLHTCKIHSISFFS